MITFSLFYKRFFPLFISGGLTSLVSITHLDISHNQLVSINGIGHLVHLLDLNLSHNHLSTVKELHTCCLLQRLAIESNSLVEVWLSDPPLCVCMPVVCVCICIRVSSKKLTPIITCVFLEKGITIQIISSYV